MSYLEHHGEFSERLLCDAGLVACLDLLLQVVLHAHAQLVQLVPLLRQRHRAANTNASMSFKLKAEGVYLQVSVTI